MSNRVPLALGLALIASLSALADSTRFSDFEPLTSSAPPLPVDGGGRGRAARRKQRSGDHRRRHLGGHHQRDLATGLPVGGGLRNADNLAIDAEGNIYIIEDRNGGSDDDIWST